MLLRFKKPNTLEDTTSNSAFSEADFIPYASHFNADTLLTKNGELLQILKISGNTQGLGYEAAELTGVYLRRALRAALVDQLDSPDYALWIHTVRRKTAISLQPPQAPEFTRKLHETWFAEQGWQYAYDNTVYITVMARGQTASLFDTKDISQGLWPSRNRERCADYLEEHHQLLQEKTDGLIAQLSAHFNLERIGLVERLGVFYSEPLELLHRVLNLQEAPMPVADMEAARQLCTHSLTFGFDAVESKSSNSKRFAALLSIKGHPEVPPAMLDRCLQLPEEMVISQAFHFIPAKQALAAYTPIEAMLESSTDNSILHVSGLSEMLSGDRESPVSYGEQQLSITVITAQYKHLDEATASVQNALKDVGILSVREDLKLEECFWAQLPGNFEFLRRKTAIATPRVGGFARLNYFPSGKPAGNHWGEAVTVLPTVLGTPYFFNFHAGANGHTALLDFNSFADEKGASLLNFLLANTCKFGGRTIIFDHFHAARPLVQALEGRYAEINPAGRSDIGINPLALEDTPRNRAFLVAWLLHFVPHTHAQAEVMHVHARAVLDELFALPPEMRTLSAARQGLIARDALLFSRFQLPQTALFSAQDTVHMHARVTAFEMGAVAQDAQLKLPVFSYLLHRVIASLDGTPTVIVLNEAWTFLNNDFFAPRLESLLDMLAANNAMVVFTTRHFEDVADEYVARELMRLTPTKLFLPDDVPVDYFPEITGLSSEEEKHLASMERQRGEFLVRHGAESVRCRFQPDVLKDLASSLAGDVQGLRIMQIQSR